MWKRKVDSFHKLIFNVLLLNCLISQATVLAASHHHWSGAVKRPNVTAQHHNQQWQHFNATAVHNAPRFGSNNRWNNSAVPTYNSGFQRPNYTQQYPVNNLHNSGFQRPNYTQQYPMNNLHTSGFQRPNYTYQNPVNNYNLHQQQHQQYNQSGWNNRVTYNPWMQNNSTTLHPRNNAEQPGYFNNNYNKHNSSFVPNPWQTTWNSTQYPHANSNFSSKIPPSSVNSYNSTFIGWGQRGFGQNTNWQPQPASNAHILNQTHPLQPNTPVSSGWNVNPGFGAGSVPLAPVNGGNNAMPVGGSPLAPVSGSPTAFVGGTQWNAGNPIGLSYGNGQQPQPIKGGDSSNPYANIFN